ncbi:hypothetical protein niasHT_032916 [Heterodera trifolii]|uniref:Uncharacterized protein n=1 Tax=Heterodera trifolii TaxID=157864 RepID=A0ABD2IXF9_9BILA
MDKAYQAIIAADSIKLTDPTAGGNANIVAKLKRARAGFKQAIDIIDTVLGVASKKRPETVAVARKSSAFLRTDDSISQIVGTLGPCFCKGSSFIIHSFLNASHSGGIGLIQTICQHIDEKTSPITSAECERFDTNLFSSTISMAIELTGPEVMCELIAGTCPRANTTVSNSGPISCAFCQLLHKKALSIINNFVRLFEGFNMMCDRLSDEKDPCRLYVKQMTLKMGYMMDLHLDEKNARSHCKYVFNCV